jgi:hypothetical protein
MKSRSQNLLTPYERKSKIVSSKNIVSHTLFHAEIIAEHTEEIMSSMEGKDFIPITSGQRLPDKFFEEFLEKQGLRLEGAEDIKSIRGEYGLSKARLEGLLRGLQSGQIRFVLRKE